MKKLPALQITSPPVILLDAPQAAPDCIVWAHMKKQ